MPERPALLSLCAMVLILFGAMALMNLATSMLVPENMQSLVGKVDDPFSAGLRGSESYHQLQRILLAPAAITGLLGIIAGIGLLRGSEAARKTGLAWAVIYLASGFVLAGGKIVCARAVIAALTPPDGVTAEMMQQMRDKLMKRELVEDAFTTVFVVAMSIAVVVLLTRRDSVAFCTQKPFSDTP